MSDKDTAAAATATAMAEMSSKVTMISSGVTVAFGLTLNEWGVIVGIATALGGLAVNVYYRRKEYRLLEAQHAKNPVKDFR
jgi:hypothetical protein